MAPEAEHFARQIPEDRADCTLARAEALAAAAKVWVRKGNADRAAECLRDARAAAAAVRPELAYGRVVVTAAIGAAEAETGLVATGAETFGVALKLAAEVSAAPGHRDPYREILNAAIRSRNVGAARRVAQDWRTLRGASVDSDVTSAWRQAGFTDEALGYVRSLPKATDRIEGLLGIANDMLRAAGGPII